MLNPISQYLMIGKLVALLGAIALICWQSSQIHKWHENATHCGEARVADRTSYEQAQKTAEALNKAHVETENKLRSQINEASRHSFTADRDRLRAQSGAAQGAAGSAGLPAVPKAAPGTPPEVLSLPPAELLRAQELELQLNALIGWVEEQVKVDPNASTPALRPQQP
jgi:hypothetical protein